MFVSNFRYAIPAVVSFGVSAFLFDKLEKQEQTRNKITNVVENSLENFEQEINSIGRCARSLIDSRSFRQIKNFSFLEQCLLQAKFLFVLCVNDLGQLDELDEEYPGVKKIVLFLKNQVEQRSVKFFDENLVFSDDNKQKESPLTSIIFRVSDEADWNHAFSGMIGLAEHVSCMKNLPHSCLESVKFADPTPDFEKVFSCKLQKILEDTGKAVDLVVLQAHGNPKCLFFLKNDFLKSSNITCETFKPVQKGKTVFFSCGCHTGRGFAQTLADVTKCDVIAPLNDASAFDRLIWCDQHGLVVDEQHWIYEVIGGFNPLVVKLLGKFLSPEYRRFTPGSTGPQPMPCNPGDLCRNIWPLKMQLALQRKVFSSPFGL